jgi:hypothetical protein
MCSRNSRAIEPPPMMATRMVRSEWILAREAVQELLMRRSNWHLLAALRSYKQSN